jgi:hypothetical protein
MMRLDRIQLSKICLGRIYRGKTQLSRIPVPYKVWVAMPLQRQIAMGKALDLRLLQGTMALVTPWIRQITLGRVMDLLLTQGPLAPIAIWVCQIMPGRVMDLRLMQGTLVLTTVWIRQIMPDRVMGLRLNPPLQTAQLPMSSKISSAQLLQLRVP